MLPIASSENVFNATDENNADHDHEDHHEAMLTMLPNCCTFARVTETVGADFINAVTSSATRGEVKWLARHGFCVN